MRHRRRAIASRKLSVGIKNLENWLPHFGPRFGSRLEGQNLSESFAASCFVLLVPLSILGVPEGLKLDSNDLKEDYIQLQSILVGQSN